LKEELDKRFSPVFIVKFGSPEGLYYRVLVGEFSSRIAASDTLQELKKAGYDVFIIRRE
jgi:hypothetical protein